MQPIDYYSDSGLQTAQQQSQQAGDAYKKAVTNAASMPDLLKQALDKKFSENNPLIQQREGALKNYMNENTAAPISVLPENNNGMIFSPLEQANMIQGRRSSALAPITSLNDLLGWQQGGLHNTIDSATKMYQALAQAAGIEADNKRKSYQDILDLVKSKAAQATTDRSFSENVRLFGLEYAIKQQEVAISALKATQAAQKVPASISKAVGDFGSVQNAINLLVDQAKKVKNRFGTSGVGGKLQSTTALLNAKAGNDPDLKRYYELRDSLASLLAKGVGRETGVLTNKDIDRALKFTSSQTPTQQELQNALNDLRGIQKTAKYNLQSQFKLNGVTWDESFVPPSPGGDANKTINYNAILESIFNEK